MKSSITNYIVSFIMIVSASVLYNWYEEKQLKMKEMNDYTDIQKYLLSDEDMGKVGKPILWIHVPHEYNSRDKLPVLLSGHLTSSGKHHFSSDVDGKLKISEN